MKYACTGALVTLAVSATAQAQEVTFDLTGAVSYDGFGSPNNVSLSEIIPAGSTLTGVSWENVVGDGLGGLTWGSEMQMAINASVAVAFFPGEGSGTAGGVWGPADGNLDLNIPTDGTIQLEFFESYDDATDVIDSEYISGTVTISYSEADPCENGVANDAAENATAFDIDGGLTSGSTVCASEENTWECAGPAGFFTGSGNDVFYSITVPETGTLTLSLCNSDFDTDLSIHDMAGNILFCDDDTCGAPTWQSELTTLIDAGDYLVRIGGWNGAFGNYEMSSSFVAGDPCAEPQIFNVVSAEDFIAQIGPGLADLCPGDIINWGPGVYNWGYTISLAANGVIHRGSVDADGNPTTIITGDNSRQCLTFFGVEIYENMIFEDGVSGGDGGAFILNPTFGKVTFRNCVFRNNTAGSLGGAVCNLGAQNGSEFIDCLFVGNSGRDAGACIALNNGADGAIFTNCEFRDNTATISGGAICTAGGSPTVNGCFFSGNSGFVGGGIYIQSGDTATVSNSTLCGNTPDQYAGPGTFDDQGGNTISDSCDPNDCNGNGIPDSDEIAGNDCDENGTLDECEIDSSSDCDGNSVLDVCESLSDCDEDGVSDCEAIAAGAEDCDADGIPDSCTSAGGTVVQTELSVDTGEISGGEFVEYTVQLDGSLDSMEAVLTFGNPDGDFTWAGDVAIQITDPSGLCTEVGSFDIETCANGILEDFPSDWDSGDEVERSYMFELCGQSLSGSGDWIIRLTHGYEAGTVDSWSGTLTFGVITTEEPCTGDLNGDGEVGFSDLQLILSAWEETDAGDANGDGVTNFSDLQVILSAWGGC